MDMVRSRRRHSVNSAAAKLKGFFLAVFATLTGAICATSAASEPVDIPYGALTLHGTLYRPAGAGPFPAVVALHDCGGILQRPQTAALLYNEWANHLLQAGFVVLFPDSFGSRGLGSQCREQNRRVRASRERVGDANAARRWLQTQPYVKADRISLLGWSNGGTTALWTTRRNAATQDGSPDFRSAVALYPRCDRLLKTAWSARVPTLILIGSADDWTLASVCQRMVAGAKGRSAHTEIIVYPDAHHEFDRANSPVRLRTGLVNTANPSGAAHGGTDPAARSDAFKRVPQWLER
jgi:dienelactone hydrolase